jgi:hypothetical protein
MAQAVSHWPFIMEDGIQSHANPCGTCSRQTIAGRFFSRHFSFPLSESFHKYSKFIHSSPTLEILANEDAVKKHDLKKKPKYQQFLSLCTVKRPSQ